MSCQAVRHKISISMIRSVVSEVSDKSAVLVSEQQSLIGAHIYSVTNTNLIGQFIATPQ